MMTFRSKKYWIKFFIGLSVLIIIAGSQYKDIFLYHPPGSHRTLRNNLQADDSKHTMPQPIPMNTYHGLPNIENILDNTRSEIELELRDYNFTHSGVHKLQNLLMESGGKPVRNVIISTWRSGSSFLGDLLNAMPGNFYHFEPLFRYGSKRIRGPPHADIAMSTLKNMLQCEYNGMEDYFEFGKSHVSQFRLNTRLWNHCKSKRELCLNADFTAKFCKLFPFQSMKIVRVRLNLVKDIFEDKELNVKVVLLIRDPRGVMRSRQHVKFCSLGVDCWKPELLCADMISDYVAAGRLFQLYPDRLLVLRFEELALNLNETTVQLLKYLRLSATQSIDEFLQTHTTVNRVDAVNSHVFSTFRVSRDVPFKWKNVLSFDHINELQDVCSEAMELWGYKLAHNASHMASEDFYPLEPFRFPGAIHEWF